MDLLFLSDHPEGPWYTATEGFVTPEDKARLAGLAPVVILSGQSVRVFEHDLPSLRGRERDNAARFFVEPRVAEDVDDLHISIAGERLALINRERMDTYVENLAQAGVSPTHIYVDFDVLPPATLADRIILDDVTLDPTFPLGEVAPPPTALADLAARIDTSEAIDLRSGSYAKRPLPSLADLGAWRWAALIPMALIAGAGMSGLAEARAEAAQIEDLRTRAAQAYADATGQSVEDPAEALRSLAAAPDGPGALELTAVLYRALESLPDVRVESLRYDETRGRLDVRFAYPSFAATAEVEAAVAHAGGQLDAGGVRETQGRFIGDAVLTVS